MTELEKWAGVFKDVTVIAQFLEWCLLNDKDPINDMTPTEDLINEYFEIDSAQLEKERRALYEAID